MKLHDALSYPPNQIIAFNTQTGQQEWSYRGIVEPARILRASSPAVSGDTVIAPFSSGEVVALRASNGQPVWNQVLSRTSRTSALSEIRDIAGRPVISRGFVYAVDTHQWDFAHECLSARSREEISRLKLEVALRFLKDPVYGEVDLFELISSSVTRRGAPRYLPEGSDRRSAAAAYIRVFAVARRGDGARVEFDTDLIFAREDGRWRFDFVGTQGAIQHALTAQGSAP